MLRGDCTRGTALLKTVEISEIVATVAEKYAKSSFNRHFQRITFSESETDRPIARSRSWVDEILTPTAYNGGSYPTAVTPSGAILFIVLTWGMQPPMEEENTSPHIDVGESCANNRLGLLAHVASCIEIKMP